MATHEVYIEEVLTVSVVFGGRGEGTNNIRTVDISRKMWDALGNPEGLSVTIQARN